MTAITIALLLMNAKCDVACKYEGFDGGYMAENKCACITYIETKDLLTKKSIATFKGIATIPENKDDAL